MTRTTWIRKNTQIYNDSHCLLCGSNYGIAGGEHRAHPPSSCKACGTPQCWTNGMAHGTCGVCNVGLLDIFSQHDRPCGYKGCGKEGVALAPRVGRVCKDHLQRAKLDVKIAQALAERLKYWRQVELDITTFPILGRSA
jgi:hypothetical protein